MSGQLMMIVAGIARRVPKANGKMESRRVLGRVEINHAEVTEVRSFIVCFPKIITKKTTEKNKKIKNKR